MRRAFAMELTLSRYIVPFVLAAAGNGLAAQERMEIVDTTFPGSFEGKNGGLVSRLVDDLTGEPIVGAEVFLVTESETPIAGEFWFDAKGTSDADGFVRILRPATPRGWDLVVMKHPTRGTVATTYAGPVWRIGRTFDVPVRVLDWLGRPAPGAMVGFCGGCGHTPDIVNAVANAQGIAVLRGIDPQQDISDLYVQHPGLHFFYNSVSWRPGEPPMDVRCAYGPAQSGKVVDHLGNPVAGAFVCGGGRHRGPWAKTGADGAFTVLGAESQETPYKVVVAPGREAVLDCAPVYPVTIRLPEFTAPGTLEATTDRPRDPEQKHVVPTRTVRVVVEGGPETVLVSADFPGRDPEAKAPDGSAIVPVDAPFALEVDDASSKTDPSRTYAFADPKAVKDQVVVKWIPDAHVVGRAVDPKGEPIAVRVRPGYQSSDEPDDGGGAALADGRFDFVCSGSGMQLLDIVPQREGLRTRRMWVLVPPRGTAAPTDLGDVVIGGPPQLRVLDANDAPLTAAKVGLVRAGWQEVEQSQVWPVADDGVWAGPDLREGDAIVVQREGHVTFRTVLTGAGPWIVRQPDGIVKVSVVDPAGAPLPAVLTFGGEEAAVKESGVATLRGLPLGPLRLFVGSPNHRSAIVDAIVTASPADVRVVLPKRD